MFDDLDVENVARKNFLYVFRGSKLAFEVEREVRDEAFERLKEAEAGRVAAEEEVRALRARIAAAEREDTDGSVLL